MSRFLNSSYSCLEPYTPGEQPKVVGRLIKLNTNENPYPPAPGVYKLLNDEEVQKLRLYPEPSASLLVDAIAEFYGVEQNQVMVGNGSDEVLAFIFMAMRGSNDKIYYPEISYSFYPVYCDIFKANGIKVPLREDYSVGVEDYYNLDGTIVITNPNAPTGELLRLDAVEEIIKANPDVIVVVDEAYIDFGGESALPLIEKYDNLIVVQTFSKSRSMAGSRIGFAISNEKVIKYLNDVKYSFNSYTMDAITIDVGTAAIEDKEYFEMTRNKIIATREWTKSELYKLGFDFGDSKSNFIFATHKDIPAVELYEALREADIYVRYFKKPERINNYLRISIGTDEEMKELIKFLTAFIHK
jgi:histidinol-phosphate aminotransferase